MNQPCSIYWPAEWHQHVATWMIFPCRDSIWTNGIEKAQRAFAQVANQISEYEPVSMLVNDRHSAQAKKYLSSEIELISGQADDSWARDTAPIWVDKDGVTTALDFQFNAWGEKFSPYDKDQKLAATIAELAGSPCSSIDMVLEGGSVHSNGDGILLTTKECLLNKNRNPNMDQTSIEALLKRSLGVEKFIWLENGVNGDVDTDGHIDNIACFVNPNTILSQSCPRDVNNLNYSIYAANRTIIQQHSFELVEIPEPEARYCEGERVPLSYINFYIANGAVIIPKFGCRQDDIAQQTIQDLFPSRKIHAIDANEILVGGGGIHCITMQQPQATKRQV